MRLLWYADLYSEGLLEFLKEWCEEYDGETYNGEYEDEYGLVLDYCKRVPVLTEVVNGIKCYILTKEDRLNLISRCMIEITQYGSSGYGEFINMCCCYSKEEAPSRNHRKYVLDLYNWLVEYNNTGDYYILFDTGNKFDK